MAKGKSTGGKAEADYRHPTSDLPLRPEVGTQAQFKKKKPPKTYRYDSSLLPALDWDGQNPAREQGEALIRQILEAESLDEAKAAAAKLKALGQAVPQLGRQGRAAVVRRADAAAVRPRAALDEGDPRDAEGARGGPAARDVRPVRRPAALDRRPGAEGLRVPGQLGQPDDPRRLARGDELAAATTRGSAGRCR